MMIEIITKGTDHPLDALLTLTNMKHVIGKILIMIHYELVTGCSPFVIMQTTVECPKMQKFGNVLLPRQKVMQMISETMPTSKKLPYLKV